MNDSLRALYERHVARSLDKQLHLSELVEEANWEFALQEGLLSFSNGLEFKVQLLGTEADGDRSWLWSWANQTQGIPAELLEDARALKALGEAQDVHELREPSFPQAQADGHTLGLIAAGLREACAYYRGPYEGGALFLLIQDEGYPVRDTPPLLRISTVFPQVLTMVEVAHRPALIGYAESYGLRVEEEGDKVVIEDGGLVGKFGEAGQLTQLTGSFGGA